MREKSHYRVMFSLHLLVMLLFIFVMYIGVYLSHWVTFDIGLFGGICACISTVYYIIQNEKAEKFGKVRIIEFEGSYFDESSEEDYDEEEYKDDYDYDRV